MRILLFIILFIMSINAQTYRFLNLITDARSAAVGGNFVANFDDPNVLFHNPSGVAGVQDYRTSFSFVDYFSDVNIGSISTKFSDNYLNYAAGVMFVNYGSIDKYDQFGNRLGVFTPTDLQIIFAISKDIENNFYYGGAAKIIYSKIDEFSSSALSFDLGMHYLSDNKDLKIGFTLRNIGFQLKTYNGIKENLPFDVKAGLNYKLKGVPLEVYFGINELNNSLSFFKHFEKISLGAELRLSKAIVVRAGYDNSNRKDLEINQSAGLSGFNLGFGINFKKIQIDYSFSSYGNIGSVNRFSLTTTF
ncbi:MAG TPA: type IX secretion system protein PorQ [Ignavibacteriales bacterium]|nr:type IX secretion system protein PorQ [Ignavibacteriales bacterium]